MSLHEQLYQWTAQGGLDATSARRLWTLSGVARPHPRPWHVMRRGAALLGAGLAGFGVILWVAANWDTLGPLARFGLLQFLLAACLLGAAAWPVARRPLGLLAFLTLGSLLALVGQTYQTGADPWTLFALWAAMGVPLALAVRSDLVWTPWTVVAAVAITLAVRTYAGHGWRMDWTTWPVHAAGLLACVLLALAMALRPGGRVQPWAWRTAVVTGTGQAVVMGVAVLFTKEIQPQFWLALVMVSLALVGAWLAAEVFAMCVLALGVDVLVMARAVRWMSFESLADMVLLALIGMGVLALSVQLIMRRVRGRGVAA